MDNLTMLIKEKMEMIQADYVKTQLSLPQIMLAVFNVDSPNDLDLPMRVIEDVENEILALRRHPDKAATSLLLPDQDSLETFLETLEGAKTESQLREILIEDLLIEKMRDNSVNTEKE